MLLRTYRADPQGLRVLLATRLLAAIGDQPNQNPIDLAVRFLGWLPPADAKADVRTEAKADARFDARRGESGMPGHQRNYGE